MEPRQVTQQGSQFVLTFPYDPIVVEAVKALPGRRFDPETKYWVIPASSAAEVNAFVDAWGFDENPDLATVAQMPARVQRPAGKVEGEVIIGERITIATSYDAGFVAKVKEIEGRRYDATDKTWSVPLESITEALALADEYKLNVREMPVAEDTIPEEPF